MPKTCAWPSCDKTAGGQKVAGWLCAQHAGKDLTAWMDSLNLNEQTRKDVMGVADNLDELRDIEEEDLAEIQFSKVAERRMRKGLGLVLRPPPRTRVKVRVRRWTLFHIFFLFSPTTDDATTRQNTLLIPTRIIISSN